MGRVLGIDAIRGAAALMIPLFHTLLYINGGGNCVLFNMLQALQIPLFMLVSGYVTRYNKPLGSGCDMRKVLWRRSFAYLVPWFVWSILMRWEAMSNKGGISYLLWHMDTGMWFLSTLWLICVIFILAGFLAVRWIRGNVIALFAVVALFCGFLVAIGLVMGISFLGIKFVLYYTLFYGMGFLWGKFKETIEAWAHYEKVKGICESLLLLGFVLVAYNVNLFAEDSLRTVILRILASVGGCVVMIDIIARDTSWLSRKLAWVGSCSLEMYVLHFFMLNIISPKGLELHTLSGVLTVGVNYILTVSFTLVAIYVLNRNKYCRLFLFGKTK